MKIISKKIISIVLLSFLIFAPLLEAYAQEEGGGDGSGSQSPETAPELLWSKRHDGAYGTPVQGKDGTIYSSNGLWNLYAFDEKGETKWVFDSKLTRLSNPSIGSDGILYVGSDQRIIAINPNGTLRWEYKVPSGSCSEVGIGSDGTLYSGCGNGDLYALHPDGTLKWQQPVHVTSSGMSKPVVSPDGNIYTIGNGKLHAISPEGVKKWEYGEYLNGMPAIGLNSEIIVASGVTDYVYAVKPDKTEIWKFFVRSIDYFNYFLSGSSVPVVDSKGTIYVNGSGRLFAINPNGTFKWAKNTNYMTNKPLILADGNILMSAWDYPLDTKISSLYKIDTNGTVIWEKAFNTGEFKHVDGTPMIGLNDVIYIGGTHLFAFKSEKPTPPEEKPLLVFVPGTLGSELYDKTDGEWVWPCYSDLGCDHENGKLDFKYELETKKEKVIFAYDDVKPFFKDKGYKDEEVVVFNYDWRDNILNNVEKLKEFIEEKNVSKVDIIGHSQGGLIATQYAAQHPGKVNKLINVGTPYYGAPKSYYVLKTGRLLGGFPEWFAFNDEIMKNVSKTMPSLYQMMPSEKFFKYQSSYYKETENSTATIYDEAKMFEKLANDYKDVPVYRDVHSNITEYYADFQKAFDENPDVEMWNIIGDSIQTIGSMNKSTGTRVVPKFHILPVPGLGFTFENFDKYEIDTVTGDETVPLISANRGGTQYLSNHFYVKKKHNHQMENGIFDDDILEAIYLILTNQDEKVTKETKLRDHFKYAEGMLLTLNSPLDLQITDSTNHIAKSITHDGQVDIENKIENAGYWVIDHNKFAALENGEYKVDMLAYDDGVFSLTFDQVEDDRVQQKIYFKDIPIQKGDLVFTSFNSSSLDSVQLNIDKDNDGDVDRIISPSFIGDEMMSQDQVGPSLDASLSGIKGNDNWYLSDVNLSLSATDGDTGTGVHKIVYQQDLNSVEEYLHPLHFTSESNKNISIQALAEDKMGNYCSLKSTQFRIDKTDPVIKSQMKDEYMVGSPIDLSQLIEVEDVGSGISKTDMYVDGEKVSNDILLAEAGSHTIKVQAEDQAGRTSVYEKTIHVFMPATITFNPKTLNQKTDGDSVATVYITLSDSNELKEIASGSLMLNNTLKPISDPKHGYIKNPIGDFNGDGLLEYQIKFNRTDLLKILETGNRIEVNVSGELTSGKKFKGIDYITVK